MLQNVFLIPFQRWDNFLQCFKTYVNIGNIQQLLKVLFGFTNLYDQMHTQVSQHKGENLFTVVGLCWPVCLCSSLSLLLLPLSSAEWCSFAEMSNILSHNFFPVNLWVFPSFFFSLCAVRVVIFLHSLISKKQGVQVEAERGCTPRWQNHDHLQLGLGFVTCYYRRVLPWLDTAVEQAQSCLLLQNSESLLSLLLKVEDFLFPTVCFLE